MANRWLRIGGGFITTVALSALVWWGLGPEAGLDRWLAKSWARGLEQASSERIASDLRCIAALDAAGLDTLLEALGSSRKFVAETAAQALHERLLVWRQWPAERSGPLAAQLARGLAERIGGWPATSQRVAADVALQLLDWPIADEQRSGTNLLVDCERILRTVPLGTAATAGTTAAGRGVPPSSPESEAGHKPGLLLPAPEAEAVPAGQVRESNPLPDLNVGLTLQSAGTRPSSDDAMTGPDSSSLFPPAMVSADEAREAGVGSDEPTAEFGGEEPTGPLSQRPDSSASAAREMALNDRSSERPLQLAKRTDLDLIFEWGSGDPTLQEAAEAELRRRGFRDYDFKLADKLISPDPADRRQVAHLVPGLTSGAGRWLIWLSYDRDRSVRQAAVALMITSRDPQVQQRLLQMEVTDADSLICERIRAWRERR